MSTDDDVVRLIRRMDELAVLIAEGRATLAEMRAYAELRRQVEARLGVRGLAERRAAA